MELRIGFDYHLAEAQPFGTEPRRWHAYCPACGWQGPDRDTKSAAENDALAHDKTENE